MSPTWVALEVYFRPSIIENIDFYPGNFSARYGRGTGGVVDLKLRSLYPDRVHGLLDISMLDAGLYVEAPIGENAAFAVAGRRSYIDVILETAINDDNFQLNSAPQWWDYHLVFDWHITPAHSLRLFGFGGMDALALQFENAADESLLVSNNQVNTEENYQRVSLQYTYQPSGQFSNDLRIGLGRDVGVADALGRSNIDFSLLQAYLRNETQWQWSNHVELTVGIDSFIRDSRYDVASIRPGKEGQGPEGDSLDGELLQAEGRDTSWYLAGFIEVKLSLASWLSLVPSLRVDRFGIIDDVTIDPRLTVHLHPHDTLSFTTSLGLVHQEPQLDELISPFGNPNLKAIRALHASASTRWQPQPWFTADLTLFYKDLDQLVSPVSSAEIYRSEGSGQGIWP